MSKFKFRVGDKIVSKYHTGAGPHGLTGTIIGKRKGSKGKRVEMPWVVEFPGFKLGHDGRDDDGKLMRPGSRSCYYHADSDMELAEKEPSKFKVGDKVEADGIGGSGPADGTVGRVVHRTGRAILVEFPGWQDGHDGGAPEGSGVATGSKECWWCRSYELKLIENPEEDGKMIYFNGINMPDEAAKIGMAIHEKRRANGGVGAQFVNGENIAEYKTELRRMYVASGGKRGAGGYEPSADELRAMYNGAYTGAQLLARNGGIPETKTKTQPKESKDVPKTTDTGSADAAQQLSEALAALVGSKPHVDPEEVKALAIGAVKEKIDGMASSLPALIAEEVARATHNVTIKVAEAPEVKVEKAHKILPRLLRYVANRKHIMIVGPAGSGKTFIAEQVAGILGLPFYMTGKVVDAIALTGYRDGHGGYRDTAFRRAYENGGVFLFDEMDGSAPDALIAFNAALAGNVADFPDGMVKRHADFVAIGAANTYGRGADRQYVGREQQDAATLDRFAVIEMDYDEELELAISCDREWTKYVQKIRAAVVASKQRLIVSPRASIEGGVMLAAGESRAEVEAAYIWKGAPADVVAKIKATLR